MSSTVAREDPPTLKNLHRRLEEIAGKQYVVGAEPARGRDDRRKNKRKGQPPRQAGLEPFAIDEVIPTAVVSPGSPEEIAAILRIAADSDYIVIPAGGMTKQANGAIPERVDILLRTHRLNKILHYDAGDLTLGVGAGITVSEIQRTLSSHAQMLPLDVMQPTISTIGGVLATNSHGPMKAAFGGVRDYCIGIEFVTGDAKIAKGGGRVVKNVAGYDLMKLMIGSHGTLGVITAANFKVFPAPQRWQTFVCECRSIVEAIALRDRIGKSPLAPMALEIVSPRAQEYLVADVAVRDPDNYAPIARVPQCSSWNILLRATGSDLVIRRYRTELGSAATRELTGDDERELWGRVTEFQPAVTTRHRNAMVVNLSVNLSDVSVALAAAEDSAVEHNLLCAVVGRVSAGALVCAFMPLGVDPPSAMQFANVMSALRGRLPGNASAVVVRCPVEAKRHFDVWGASPTDLVLMRSVRAVMDPKHVLNRGRFIV